MRSRAIRDALEVMCAVEFLMERGAGLVRGVEFRLVADRCHRAAGAIDTDHRSRIANNAIGRRVRDVAGVYVKDVSSVWMLRSASVTGVEPKPWAALGSYNKSRIFPSTISWRSSRPDR
jgi:hypothetical protein